MAATVSEILVQRATAGEPPRVVAVALSLAAHTAFLGLLIVMARPRPIALVPHSLPVRVVSPASLDRLGSRPSAPAAAIAAPAPVPIPEKGRPVIEKPSDAEKPRTTEKAMPLPKAKKEKPVPASREAKSHALPALMPAQTGPLLDLPTGARTPGEGGSGAAIGGFGAAVSSFDADFPFAYYVEQLQSLIGANWLKPQVADGTTAVVAFRILRSGQITDVKVESGSGVSVYDRAVTRAIYAANPLPPLPPEYRGDTLGVHIKFQ
jgi:TonB family protein